MAPPLQLPQAGRLQPAQTLLLLLGVLGWGHAQVQVGGQQAANQDIEVLSHICKYGVHPGAGGRR